jgi:hypothetical protein
MCLGLMGAGVVYLTSCAAQKGPLSPNTGLLNYNSASTGLPVVKSTFPATLVGTAIAVSQTVQVTFNMSMNPASFNTSTVQMFAQSVDGFSETAYPNYTLRYDATGKTLFISPLASYNSGFWADHTTFRLLLTTGVTSISGASLDGNRNGIAEGAAFDNTFTWFYTGAAMLTPGYANVNAYASTNFETTAALNVTGLSVNYYSVNADGTTSTATASLATANLAGIAAALPVTITAVFNNRLDLATAWVSATALAPAFVLTDANGTPVAPTSVTLTGNNDTMQAVFMGGLSPNTKYKMMIKGGLSGLRSSDEAILAPGYSGVLMRHSYFSGKGNGYAQASDDTKYRYLFTTASAFTVTAANEPPQVSGVTYDSTNRRFVVVFNTFSGNNKMDSSTLNISNIQLLLNANNSAAVTGSGSGSALPKNLVYDIASNTLYVYVPDHFSPNPAYFQVLISHNVRDASGLYLDGSRDGISSLDYNDDVLAGDGYTDPLHVGTVVSVSTLF